MAERDAPDLRPGISELDSVRLTAAIRLDEGTLRAGDEGTVVHRYRNGEAFEVEFTLPLQALLTLRPNEIEPVRI